MRNIIRVLEYKPRACAGRRMKILLNTVGCIAVVLAILGIFLPLLPTTPFLLLASACFLRGSERMHRWLMNNPLFGKYIRNIEEKRGLPRKAKATILLLMWGSLSWSIFLVHSVPVRIALLATGAGVTVYLLRMKTLPARTARENAVCSSDTFGPH
jgi:uncharacterized membrane protein YbaN (DUF454 family)